MKWRAFRHSGGSEAYYVRAGDGRLVAGGLAPEDAELIAAAPEMKRLLEELLDYFPDDEMREVRALLARIEGKEESC